MKELLVWTKNLEIGIEEIDKQHANLIFLISKAYKIHDKKNKSQMGSELNSLMEFARVHFSTEEKYFTKWDYPYADEHMEKHADILEKLLKYKNDFDNGKCDCLKFLSFLSDWIEEHLKKYDFKYRDYFKEKGYIK